MTIPGVALTGVQKKTIDRSRAAAAAVSRVAHAAGISTPGDAALDVVADVLAGGKNSRLYKRLVYDMQIAQSVERVPELAGAVVVFPHRGDAAAGTHRSTRSQKVIDEEIAKLQQRAADPSTSSSARSTRSKRRSTTGWSASADSAARRIS